MTDHLGQAPALGVDQRPRQLLERYATLVGAPLHAPAAGIAEFTVPVAEHRHWDQARRIQAVLSPDLLDDFPDAEILAIGSPLFHRLISAIRQRGFLDTRGMVPPVVAPSPEAPMLPLPVAQGFVESLGAQLTSVPVGRLLCKVSIRAGSRLHEQLVESLPIDFSTGQVLSPALVAALAGDAPASDGPFGVGAVPAPHRPIAELLPLLFAQLEQQLADELRRLRDEAARSLATEVARLDRYYERMLQDVDDEGGENGGAAKRAIRADQQRRRDEEEERHRVRITVHPVQITEWRVLAQRATWRLTSARQRSGTISATRMLSGWTDWQIACPSCAVTTAALLVCREGHVACASCSSVCGVCGEAACTTHGVAVCATGAHPVCTEHVRTCPACEKSHCTTHSAHCDATNHDVCPSCAVACAICGAARCTDHATHTGPASPRGSRWLCARCTVLCESGTNEPVGKDEAVRCTSCERHICATHQVSCAVDGAPHCSSHLRRSDRSGRLVCEAHRAPCEDEPRSVLASDEVLDCAECGRRTCSSHGNPCYADGAHYCATHLVPLTDRAGERGCEHHRSTCHVDGAAFSLEGTTPCAVCGRSSCLAHRSLCRHCGRVVCTRELADHRCRTCRGLTETADPAEELVQAAVAAMGGERVRSKGWRTAQDVTGTVVEVNLGWTRRLVFSVLHGDSTPRHIMRHSMLGSKRAR